MENSAKWMRPGSRMTWTKMRWTGVLGAIVLFGLTGCFGLSRGETPQEHYVLGSGGTQTGTQVDETDGLTLGVRRLQLDAYLQTPLIVVRRGAHQVRFSESHRWGEPLEGGINRAVAGHLSGRASIHRVEVAPWSTGIHFDYLVQLHVSRFEGVVPDDDSGAAGEAHLRASWEIIRQQDGVVAFRGTTEYRAPGWIIGDYAALVTLLDRGLDRLSQELADGLEALPAATLEAQLPVSGTPPNPFGR